MASPRAICVLAALVAASPSALAQGAGDAASRWCAPELEVVGDEVCAFTPPREGPGPRTLVVFLHGVIKPDSGWQWAQQRAAARAASHGFAVLMPRGRQGIGPKGMEDWWAWPTGATAQASVEAEVIAGWAAAREAIEKKSGKPFERVWIFGFSNGAYYAADLALRGRLASPGGVMKVDGFGVFAGGSGAPHLERAGRAASERAPVFVGWGGKDPAHGDQIKLARLLRSLGWPSRSAGAPRAGHLMTDQHVADAVKFLRATRPASPPPRKAPPRPRRGRGA